MLVTHDLHCHTSISSCARRSCSVEAHVAAAVEAGLALVGVTDHINEYDAKRVRAIQALHARVHGRSWPIEVRVGTELSLLAGGGLPAPREAIDALDYFIVSPNHYGIPGAPMPPDWHADSVADFLLDRFVEAISHRPLAVSHPFNHGYTGYVPRETVLDAIDRDRLRAVLARAAEVGTAVELNARKVGTHPPFYADLIAAGRETGVRFTLCTDAHEPAEMAYGGPAGRRQYENLLRDLGLTDDLVWSPDWGKPN